MALTSYLYVPLDQRTKSHNRSMSFFTLLICVVLLDGFRDHSTAAQVMMLAAILLSLAGVGVTGFQLPLENHRSVVLGELKEASARRSCRW